MMRIRDYLATLDREPIRMKLGLDDAEFILLLRPLDRAEFDEITRKTSKKEVDPVTRQLVSRLDEKKLRDVIVDKVLVGWEGLTQGIVARLARRTPVNGADKELVDFSAENALDLLTTVLGIENEIWRETLRSVERRDADESAEKKT